MFKEQMLSAVTDSQRNVKSIKNYKAKNRQQICRETLLRTHRLRVRWRTFFSRHHVKFYLLGLTTYFKKWLCRWRFIIKRANRSCFYYSLRKLNFLKRINSYSSIRGSRNTNTTSPQRERTVPGTRACSVKSANTLGS